MTARPLLLTLIPLLVLGLAADGRAAPRRAGAATLVSVDGPARLTVKTKSGKLRIRLFSIDTPQVGECGAPESIAALKKLAKRGKGRFRYELLDGGTRDFERDAEGRYLAFLAPPGQDGFFSGLGQDLVDTEWARNGDALALTQPPITHGDLTVGGAGAGFGSSRTPRGVWALCGGRMHLPASQPVPSHAPATWAITADGVTESIGPLALSPTLSPSTNLTVAQVAALAPVELYDVGGSQCRASVPSLQLVLSAATPGKQPCGSAEVFAVVTSGPGAAATTQGVGVGSSASAAKAAFPRLAGGTDGEDGGLRLTGADALPWAWQTQAGVDERTGTIDGFYTSAGPDGD